MNIGGGRIKDESLQQQFARSVPLKRLASTEESKGLALFWASPGGSFITGEHIVIYGGGSLGTLD